MQLMVAPSPSSVRNGCRRFFFRQVRIRSRRISGTMLILCSNTVVVFQRGVGFRPETALDFFSTAIFFVGLG